MIPSSCWSIQNTRRWASPHGTMPKRVVRKSPASCLAGFEGRGRVSHFVDVSVFSLTGGQPEELKKRPPHGKDAIHFTSWDLRVRSPCSTASSNCCSSHGEVPRSPVTTSFAHCTYSSRRFTDQSGEGLLATARTLLILSASLINLASRLLCGADSTCRRLRSAFGSDLSSVTSNTM